MLFFRAVDVSGGVSWEEGMPSFPGTLSFGLALVYFFKKKIWPRFRRCQDKRKDRILAKATARVQSRGIEVMGDVELQELQKKVAAEQQSRQTGSLKEKDEPTAEPGAISQKTDQLTPSAPNTSQDISLPSETVLPPYYSGEVKTSWEKRSVRNRFHLDDEFNRIRKSHSRARINIEKETGNSTFVSHSENLSPKDSKSERNSRNSAVFSSTPSDTFQDKTKGLYPALSTLFETSGIEPLPMDLSVRSVSDDELYLRSPEKDKPGEKSQKHGSVSPRFVTAKNILETTNPIIPKSVLKAEEKKSTEFKDLVDFDKTLTPARERNVKLTLISSPKPYGWQKNRTDWFMSSVKDLKEYLRQQSESLSSADETASQNFGTFQTCQSSAVVSVYSARPQVRKSLDLDKVCSPESSVDEDSSLNVTQIRADERRQTSNVAVNLQDEISEEDKLDEAAGGVKPFARSESRRSLRISKQSPEFAMIDDPEKVLKEKKKKKKTQK